MADNAKTADDDAAGITEREAEDSGLLTSKQHMDFINASNERVEADRKAAEDAMKAQVDAINNPKAAPDDSDKKTADIVKRDTSQGDKA